MYSRIYCFSLAAISGLLFSFQGVALYAFVFLLLSFLPLILVVYRQKKGFINILLAISCVFIFMFIGYRTWGNEPTSLLFGNETIFEGEIINEPTITTTNQWSFQLKLKNSEVIQMFMNYEDTVPMYGSRCMFKGELTQPSAATNFHGFDYQQYLKKLGIHWIVRPITPVQCTESLGTFKGYLLKVRNSGLDKIMSKENSETAAVMAALVFGERTFMTEERVATYQQLGVVHLLAVSGLHVGLISVSLFFILCRIGLTREKSSFAILVLLPMYIILAGGAPSVMRASLMTSVIILSSLLGWRIRAIDLISLLLLIFLIINPYLLFHLGFQLSFLTSFALIMSNSFFRDHRGVNLLIRVTFVAQLISLPLILYHFYEISILSIPVNLLFIPFVSMLILPLSFMTILFYYFIPPLANVSFYIADKSLLIVNTLIDQLSSWKWDMLVFGKPSPIIILLLFAAILLLFVSIEKKKHSMIVVSCLLVVGILFYQHVHPYFRQHAVLTVLDIGQGDSIVIELPYRRGVYVIDTGGRVQWGEGKYNSYTGPGKRVIEPFLKGNGIKSIDGLILTHGHVDHLGEACIISSLFSIEEVLYPAGTPMSKEAIPILQCILEKEKNISFVKEGYRWKKGGGEFFILSPSGNEKDENERSIVMLITIEDISILLTGDIEAGTEKRIVQAYPPLNIDVLKVAHHGSKTSTTELFLQHFSPRIGLISAGRNNRFGHPHEEILERLAREKIYIFRTDEDGAIQMLIKNGKISVNTTIKRK